MADKSLHTAILEEIREKKARLLAELDKLDAVEEWHVSALQTAQGTNGAAKPKPKEPVKLVIENETPAEAADPERGGMPKWLLCKEALLQLGRTARVPEIAKIVHPGGFLTPGAQRVFNNSLYNAMNRKGDLFRQKRGSSEWGLVEWLEKPS